MPTKHTVHSHLKTQGIPSNIRNHRRHHVTPQPSEDRVRPAGSEAKGQRTKGKGLGLKVLGKTEANAEAPAAGIAPGPTRDTEALRPVESGTAPDHALAAVASIRL